MPGRASLGEQYAFDGFRLDPHRAVLTRNGGRVALTPRAVRTLTELIENRDTVASKEELIRRVWGAIVDENNLNQSISAIRRALGDSPKESRYLVTVPRTGYRFVGLVETKPELPTSAPEQLPPAAIETVLPAAEPLRSVAWHWWILCAVLLVGALAAGATFLQSPEAERQLAVLPFEDRSRHTDAALVDGVSEEIARGLAKVAKFRIAARNSAFQFRGRPVDARDAGRRLDVEYLVQGQITSNGESRQIEAWVVRTRDGAESWRRRYEGRDLPALEQDLTRDLASRLSGGIAGAKPLIIHRPVVNPEAHDLYLRGRYEWYKREGASMSKSIEYLERAVALDPGYALAQAALADSHGLIAAWTLGPSLDALRKAEAAARRAIALDSELAEGYAALGLIQNAQWNWGEAEHNLRRALELNPGMPLAYQRLGLNYTVQKRFEEALPLLRTAQTLDPLQWFIEYNIGELYFFWRRYDDALRQTRRIEELRGRVPAYRNLTGRIYIQQRRFADLQQLCANVSDADSDYSCPVALAHGDYKRQLSMIDKWMIPAARYKGSVYAQAGRVDEAFVWLEKAYALRDPNLVDLAIDPAFKCHQWNDLSFKRTYKCLLPYKFLAGESLPLSSAIIAVMVFSFARISAAVSMKIEDYVQAGKRCRFRFMKKGGKYNVLALLW